MGFCVTDTMPSTLSAPRLRRQVKETPPKNRIWNFSATSRNRAGRFSPQPVEPHWETCSTSTKTVSGISSFLNRDPIGEDGGLLLYGFVGNTPVNGVDIFGLSWWWVDGKGVFAAPDDSAAAASEATRCHNEMMDLIVSAVTAPVPLDQYEYVWQTYDHATGKWTDDVVDKTTFWTRLLDEKYTFVKANMKTLANEVANLQAIVGAHQTWDTTVYTYHTLLPFPGKTLYKGPPPTAKSASTVTAALAAVVPTKGTFIVSTCVPAVGGVWAEEWAVKPVAGSCNEWVHNWSWPVATGKPCTIKWPAAALTKEKT